MFRKKDEPQKTQAFSDQFIAELRKQMQPEIDAAVKKAYADGQEAAYTNRFQPRIDQLNIRVATISDEYSGKLAKVLSMVEAYKSNVEARYSESEKAAKQNSDASRAVLRAVQEGSAQIQEEVEEIKSWGEQQQKSFAKETAKPV